MDTKLFLLSLLVALLMGGAAIFEKMSLKGASPLTVFTIRSVFMVLCLVVACFFSGDGLRSLTQISGKTLFFIIIPAIFALVFVFTYFTILRNDLASRVVPIVAAAPLVTVFLSVLFLGEPFSWRRLIGAILIVAGVSLVK